MTHDVKISLPKLGESILSATVVRWFKKVGDPIALDEPLLEVSTDKVNSEIPSPVAGTLLQILANVDEEVQVGAPLAVIGAKTVHESAHIAVAPPPAASREDNFDVLSPAVLRLLKEKGIAMQDIDRIPRTGQGGRLTRKDIEDYCLVKAARADTERVKMSTLRKAIAENMVRSFYEAPHASLATEVDVTPIVQYIQQHKQAFLEQHGVKLSITAFVARAITRAVAAFPLINASLEGDTIVMKRFVNLGIAVSVEQGVMVPVIHKCHSLSLADISKQIALLAAHAREQKLTKQDVSDGTLTLTNFGMTGVHVGIPIIRYPEVAIIGLGAITKKVTVMPDESTAIRSIMWVSITFDHRVLDGLYGCGFLNALKKELEHGER